MTLLAKAGLRLIRELPKVGELMRAVVQGAHAHPPLASLEEFQRIAGFLPPLDPRLFAARGRSVTAAEGMANLLWDLIANPTSKEKLRLLALRRAAPHLRENDEVLSAVARLADHDPSPTVRRQAIETLQAAREGRLVKKAERRSETHERILDLLKDQPEGEGISLDGTELVVDEGAFVSFVQGRTDQNCSRRLYAKWMHGAIGPEEVAGGSFRSQLESLSLATGLDLNPPLVLIIPKLNPRAIPAMERATADFVRTSRRPPQQIVLLYQETGTEASVWNRRFLEPATALPPPPAAPAMPPPTVPTRTRRPALPTRTRPVVARQFQPINLTETRKFAASLVQKKSLTPSQAEAGVGQIVRKLQAAASSHQQMTALYEQLGINRYLAYQIATEVKFLPLEKIEALAAAVGLTEAQLYLLSRARLMSGLFRGVDYRSGVVWVTPPPKASAKTPLRKAVQEAIREEVKKRGGNMLQASRELGFPRKTLSDFYASAANISRNMWEDRVRQPIQRLEERMKIPGSISAACLADEFKRFGVRVRFI